MKKLRIKLAHILLRGLYKFPTADEIVTITRDGKDIKMGERIIDRNSIGDFGVRLTQIADNEVLNHVMNSVIFKWQMNLMNNNIDRDVVRNVSELYADTGTIIDEVKNAYLKKMKELDLG